MPILNVSFSELSLVSLAEMSMQLGDVDKTLVSTVFVMSFCEYIFCLHNAHTCDTVFVAKSR